MTVVVAVYGKADWQFATVFIEANSLEEAHAVAISFMQEKNPETDFSDYNQTIAM